MELSSHSHLLFDIANTFRLSSFFAQLPAGEKVAEMKIIAETISIPEIERFYEIDAINNMQNL